MYRVFLNPTEADPRKELWLDAATVRESSSGTLWEFRNEAGSTVRRVLKAKVTSFEQVADRRRPIGRRPVKPPEDIWNRRFDDVRPVKPAPKLP